MNKLKIVALGAGVLLVIVVGALGVTAIQAMTRAELRTKNALMCEQIFSGLLKAGRAAEGSSAPLGYESAFLGYAYDVYKACGGELSLEAFFSATAEQKADRKDQDPEQELRRLKEILEGTAGALGVKSGGLVHMRKAIIDDISKAIISNDGDAEDSLTLLLELLGDALKLLGEKIAMLEAYLAEIKKANKPAPTPKFAVVFSATMDRSKKFSARFTLSLLERKYIPIVVKLLVKDENGKDRVVQVQVPTSACTAPRAKVASNGNVLVTCVVNAKVSPQVKKSWEGTGKLTISSIRGKAVNSVVTGSWINGNFFAGPDAPEAGASASQQIQALDGQISALIDEANKLLPPGAQSGERDKGVKSCVSAAAYTGLWKSQQENGPKIKKLIEEVRNVVTNVGQSFSNIDASRVAEYLFEISSKIQSEYLTCQVDSLQAIIDVVDKKFKERFGAEIIAQIGNHIGEAMGKKIETQSSESSKSELRTLQANWNRLRLLIQPIDEKAAKLKNIDTQINSAKAERAKLITQPQPTSATQPTPATQSTQPTQQTPSAQPTTQVTCTTTNYDVVSWCDGPIRQECANGQIVSSLDCRSISRRCVNIVPYEQDGSRRLVYRSQCE